MSVKTLNGVQSLTTAGTGLSGTTYSIAPLPRPNPSPAEEFDTAPSRIECFLEQENPLGCIRGVMWVMAFNAGVFALGLLIWQSCKFIR